MEWNLTSEIKPNLGDHVEISEDGINKDGMLVYIEGRRCMLAGFAGGYGYFDEGFATDGIDCDFGLICADPKYWRLPD